VFHELTTNAVKYGAWSQPEGAVAVEWDLAEDRLQLQWREWAPGATDAEQPEQSHRGFGSTLIDGSARQLGGTIDRRFTPAGVIVRIDLPLGA
jgi:two-component sensor histidine kinase